MPAYFQMRARGTRAGFAALLLGMLFAACSQPPKEPEKPGAKPPAAGNSGVDAERIYRQNCLRCHRNGEGVPGLAPPLEGNDVVTNHDATELVRGILFGMTGKTIEGREYPGRMPGFAEVLSDEEIAACANYVRKQWGDAKGTVTAADVKKERARP